MSDDSEPEVLPGPFKHILRPKDGDVFYHYCSVETFRIICEHKTLRFSDINMLNDYQEDAWGYRVFEEAASRMLGKAAPPEIKGLDKSFFDDVDKVMSSMQANIHPLVCSFSRKPDVLSQWRAYADDGLGVSIGFTAQTLAALPCMLLNVEYNPEQQVSDMIRSLISLYLIEEERGHSRGPDFQEMCIQLAMFKVAFKNPAFLEEDEVRSVHMLSVKTDDERPRLFDEGGLIEGKEEVSGQEVKYRTRDSGLVAYIDIPFRFSAEANPIKEVMLGPRNPNWVGNVMYMMGNYGLKGFGVAQSTASYR